MSREWHPDLWNIWTDAADGSRLHHAWMLIGAEGLGKGAFARQAARYLVGEEPEGDRPHPDILLLSRQPRDDKEEAKRADGKPFERNRNIKVGQVREMQRRITTRPTTGPRRAILINPADDMEKGAANALLKSLEEPPQGTLFLLISHRPGRLLPTIRSRCRILRFSAADDLLVRNAASSAAPDASEIAIDAAVEVADGAPGAAARFLALGLENAYTIMTELVTKGDPDMVLSGKLAGSLGARPSRETQIEAIDLARKVLYLQRRSAPGHSLRQLAASYAALGQLSAQVPTYNFDPGLLIHEIASLLAQAGPDRDHA